MICVLKAIFGPAKGRVFSVRLNERADVGRSTKADVSIAEDPHLSRHHAVVEAKLRQDGSQAFRLRDLGSSNGTYVNDVRVTSVDLADGDSVRLGSSNFHVRITETSASQVKSPEKLFGQIVEEQSQIEGVVPVRTFTLSPLLSDEDITRCFLTGRWTGGPVGYDRESEWWRDFAFAETELENVFRMSQEQRVDKGIRSGEVAEANALLDESEGLLPLLVDHFDHSFNVKCFVDIEHGDAELRYRIGELMGGKLVKWCTPTRCIVTKDRSPAFRRFLYAARNLSSCIVVGAEARLEDRWFFRIAEQDFYLSMLTDPNSSVGLGPEDWPSGIDWILVGNPGQGRWKLLLAPVLELSD